MSQGLANDQCYYLNHYSGSRITSKEVWGTRKVSVHHRCVLTSGNPPQFMLCMIEQYHCEDGCFILATAYHGFPRALVVVIDMCTLPRLTKFQNTSLLLSGRCPELSPQLAVHIHESLRVLV